MKHAFIMDPPERVRAYKDTTYFLMRAAAERGHQVCHLQQDALRLEHERVRAAVTWVQVNAEHARPFTVLEHGDCGDRDSGDCDLSDMDVVWIRTDPPLDRRYFYATLLLDYLPATTRVINRPSGIRNWNEKLAALHCPQFSPPTLVTNEPARIVAFAQQHGRIAVKPVDGHGGKGIVFYGGDGAGDGGAGDADDGAGDGGDGDGDDGNGRGDGGDGDDRAALDAATAGGRRWVVAQQYLPAARDGDKRILLLDGEPLGAILRVHAAGAELNNLDAGGSAHPAAIDARDAEICAALKPGLRAQGIRFAGIDIIGGKLIEVNVTSPTGLQELCRFTGEDFHHQIIKAVE